MFSKVFKEPFRIEFLVFRVFVKPVHKMRFFLIIICLFVCKFVLNQTKFKIVY